MKNIQKYFSRVSHLEKQCSGVDGDPEQMGTSGLVAWVASSVGLELHRRYRKARSVIRRRNGDSSVAPFSRACINAAPSNHVREKLKHFARDVL